MSNKDDGASKIINKIKNNKLMQVTLIIILFIIAVVILFVDNTSNKDISTASNSVDEYVQSLEARLENTLSKVKGAGAVSVVITVESGMETVLATETTKKETSTGTEILETPIIVNGKTIVLKELYPEITGVLIVAEGANNISVFTKIQQATKSLLGINENCIEILTMK